MSPRRFAALAVATALSLGLAAFAVVERDVPSAGGRADQPMFAKLLDRLNEVVAMRVTGPDGIITLRRDTAGKWVLPERGGYPADVAKVRELALDVAGLQLVEAKTANEDRLPRLDLGEPGKKGARSKEVELLGQADKPLAALIIGKSNDKLSGGGRSGVYVRRKGDSQAWLAAGQLEVPSAPMDLVKREFVNLQPPEIARITLAADGPAPVVLTKPDAKAESFTLQGAVPPGKKPDPEKLERLAGSLVALTMQDVKPAAQVPVPPGTPKARFETWGGLRLDVAAVTEGAGDKAEHWLILAPAKEPPVGPPPTPGPGEAASSPLSAGLDAMRAEVAGWAFKVPDYIAERMAWKEGDLLTDANGAS